MCYGHICGMSDTRLPKQILHGQVRTRGVVGRPRKYGAMFCRLTPRV